MKALGIIDCETSILMDKLKEMFFGQNEIEKQIIDEIKILLANYNFQNKRLLIDLIKLEYN